MASYHLFSDTPKEFSLRLKKEIYDVAKIHCAICVRENLLLSKVALDNEAKKCRVVSQSGAIRTRKKNHGILNHYQSFGGSI